MPKVAVISCLEQGLQGLQGLQEWTCSLGAPGPGTWESIGELCYTEASARWLNEIKSYKGWLKFKQFKTKLVGVANTSRSLGFLGGGSKPC